jgi:hypothetical protein
MGIVQSLTHTNMGFIPIWGLTELIPKLERHSKWGPHIGMGIPISVWVGICQYSKSGSPHTNMGFIPIWGPTHTLSYLAGPFFYNRTDRVFFQSLGEKNKKQKFGTRNPGDTMGVSGYCSLSTLEYRHN